MKNWRVAVLFPLTFFIHTAYAEFNTNEALKQQRAIFARAEHALKKNDLANYEKLSQQITTYPLYPYLVHEHLKQQIKASAPSASQLEEIIAFEKQYPDFPFTYQLRNQWLNHAAAQQKWQLYVDGYQPTENAALSCHYLNAQFALTKNKAYLDEAKSLWLVNHEQPDNCEKLFHQWHKSHGLTNDLIWQRIKLCMEAKKYDLAIKLAKSLPKTDRHYVEEWVEFAKSPALILDDNRLKSIKSPETIKLSILAQAIGLLAKNDGEKARLWWETHAQQYVFSELQLEQIRQKIANCLAHQRNPHAREWLNTLAENEIDQSLKEWRIRLAIFDKDWPAVLTWIDKLPDDAKHERDWQYWRARALEATEQPGFALIYAKLAKTRSYYGFLASTRLKQKISLDNRHISINPSLIQQVKMLPAMQRFDELQLLNKTSQARVEWFRAVKEMSENEILAAAKIAQAQNLYDIAILTVAKTSHKDDIALRFPLVYKDIIIAEAHKNNLDPAWIFAIARQESAFFDHAVSTAGARGLMQLLPATAQDLARKNQIPYSGENSLHASFTNIELGSLYLKNLKDRMRNHPIIATAAYNAGPTNAVRWLPKETLEADIWIESIPFKETREYVKNVLTFTNIYRQRLGTPAIVMLMMKPIEPKSA